jgi:hypothetical protein
MGSGAAAWCFLDYVNLPFHEAGHLFLTPLGTTMHYLGGTILQLAVPVGLAAYFVLRRRAPYSAALCLWWLGESLVNVGWYMSSARTLDVPLVGGGDHDWNELFYRFGLLGEGSVAAVSAGTHRLGVVVMLAGLAWAAFFTLPEHAREAVKDRIGARLPSARLFLE